MWAEQPIKQFSRLPVVIDQWWQCFSLSPLPTVFTGGGLKSPKRSWSYRRCWRDLKINESITIQQSHVKERKTSTWRRGWGFIYIDCESAMSASMKDKMEFFWCVFVFSSFFLSCMAMYIWRKSLHEIREGSRTWRSRCLGPVCLSCQNVSTGLNLTVMDFVTYLLSRWNRDKLMDFRGSNLSNSKTKGDNARSSWLLLCPWVGLW